MRGGQLPLIAIRVGPEDMRDHAVTVPEVLLEHLHATVAARTNELSPLPRRIEVDLAHGWWHRLRQACARGRRAVDMRVDVDEFGEVTGLVSLTDVVSSIVGDLPGEPGDEPMIVRRQDGSWLLDGALDRESLARVLGHFSFFDDERKPYHTLGGLVMDVIGRIPRTGDTFTLGPFRFEVVDMDGHRVDRVMVSNT